MDVTLTVMSGRTVGGGVANIPWYCPLKVQSTQNCAINLVEKGENCTHIQVHTLLSARSEKINEGCLYQECQWYQERVVQKNRLFFPVGKCYIVL